MSKVKSDGGSTSYYELPEDAKELNDLIEHKEMNFALGNIFKACYRLGEKEGNDLLYDLNKMVYFANRLINKEKKRQARMSAQLKRNDEFNAKALAEMAKPGFISPGVTLAEVSGSEIKPTFTRRFVCDHEWYDVSDVSGRYDEICKKCNAGR